MSEESPNQAEPQGTSEGETVPTPTRPRDPQERFASQSQPPDPPSSEQLQSSKPERDFEAELAASQQRTNELNAELIRLQNSNQLTEENLRQLSAALANEIQNRARIEAEYMTFKQKMEADLSVASQATQTLTTEKQTLEQQLQQAEAKATKFEIITNEFPDLLSYAALIPASADPEAVRSVCKQLQMARAKDFEAIRAQSVTSLRVPPSALPATGEPSFGDPEAIQRYLYEAMDDPAEFSRREALVQQQLMAAMPRA